MLLDFNAILHLDERIGGEAITLAEMKNFANCLEKCELEEVRSVGVTYTWTNKTVWSKIDRVLANSHWYTEFGYTHVTWKIEGPLIPSKYTETQQLQVL